MARQALGATSDQMDNSEVLDLRGLVAILRRRVRLIGLSIALVLAAAFVHLVQATPLYTARALILVETAQRNLLSGQEVSQSAQIASSIIESEVEILRSDAVLLALIERANIMQDPEFGPSLSRMDRVRQALGLGSAELPPEVVVNSSLQKLRGAISVRRRGLTSIVEVSVTSRSPERAAEINNTLFEVYIERQIASKSQSFIDSTAVLGQQLEAAERSLAQSDQALADFIDQNLDALEAESGSEAVARLRARLDALNQERLSSQVVAESSLQALEAGDLSTMVAQLQEQGLRSLDQQRQQLAQRLGETEEGSAEAINLRLSLANLERQLEEQGRIAIAELQQSSLRLQDDAVEVRDTLRRELLGGDLSAETLSRIFGLQQEAAIAQRTYTTLLNRIRELETQAMVQVADARVVSPALPPSSASSPNTRLILSAALVLAVGIGIGLAFLSEFYLGGINSSTQLTNITGARVGAVIPRVSQSNDQLSVADVVVDSPMSQFPEGMRRLRANIERFSPPPKWGAPVIMVTSALPAEGKSVTALSLARTFAMAGKRCLLIDADLRKPSAHVLTGLDLPSGLYEFLSASADNEAASECFGFDPKSSAGIIVGRERSGQPTDQLVQSEAFLNVIKDACKRFDVVVIDTPPLIPVVDARYIAMQVDCAVFSVRAGETSQSDVRFAHDQLRDYMAEDAVILAVLNFHVGQESASRYSGYYY